MKVWEVLTPRRLVTTALLLLAAVLSIVGFQAVQSPSTTASCGSGLNGASPIQTLFPCPGDSELRQGRIGASLANGYTGDLYVDGTMIPKPELIVEGPEIFFEPGPGTVTGALAPGEHVAKLVYYRLLDTAADGTTYSWSFSTH